MKINVGSKNKVKIDAVKESVGDYDFLSDVEVVPFEVSSQISEQPRSNDPLPNLKVGVSRQLRDALPGF